MNKNLNPNSKSIKLVEENIGVNYDIWLVNCFLNMKPKAEAAEEKID